MTQKNRKGSQLFSKILDKLRNPNQDKKRINLESDTKKIKNIPSSLYFVHIFCIIFTELIKYVLKSLYQCYNLNILGKREPLLSPERSQSASTYLLSGRTTGHLV